MAQRGSKRGLGRGLASLIPDSSFEDDDKEVTRAQLRHVPLDQIRPNPEQPREVFDAEALGALASSIRAHGVLTPLVVRADDGKYTLIAGERRFRAAGLAGLHEVPCVVRQADRARDQLVLALVENLQRADLDPIEAARGYQRLSEEFGLTQEAIASGVGRNRATIANAMRLLALPDAVLEVVREGRLSAGHARAVLPLLEDDAALRRTWRNAEAQSWSVRETERQVARIVSDARPRKAKKAADDKRLSYATGLLRDALQTSVAIKPRKDGSGRIVLDYADGEDLERLIGQLRDSKGG